ncbi:tetratricopeptide repeat protein [Clostridioides difficile]|nr:tetratricopeptide repeat protein [Clostridioides difficile]
MRGRVILLISILSIFLVGCSFNNKDEINLTEQGKTYLEKHDYKKAMESLSSALEEDNTNENARAMYMQAMRMSNMTEFEEVKNYEDAIKELKLIEKIKNGSSVIKEEATKKKEELTKLEKEQNEAEEQRKKKAKDTAGEDRYRVESDARKTSYSRNNKSNKSSSKNDNKKSDDDKSDNNNGSSQNQEKPNNNPTPTPPSPETNGGSDSGGNSQNLNNQ